MNVELAWHTYSSIAGLALDFIGAALLAHDVLYGPEARFQASIRRDRLARRGPALTTDADTPTVLELRFWEMHERRAQYYALLGLALLMAGFALQGVSTLLSVGAVERP